MSISIKRNTGLIGSGIAMAVKVNGKKVTKIPQDQQIELEIPGNKATVRVSQLGIKSNEVEIKNGEKLEVTTRNWIKTSIILFFVALLLVNIILDLPYRIIASLILFIFLMGTYFLVGGFQLHVEEFRARKVLHN